MTFRASSVLLSDNLTRAKQLALSLKNTAATASVAAAGGMTADDIFRLQATMQGMVDNFTTIAAVPGLGAYAQSQEGNGGYDIAAEFTAMLSAIATVRDWIESAFPKDANGVLLSHSFINHVRTPVSFTSQQLQTLRTQLLALADTIS